MSMFIAFTCGVVVGALVGFLIGLVQGTRTMIALVARMPTKEL